MVRKKGKKRKLKEERKGRKRKSKEEVEYKKKEEVKKEKQVRLFFVVMLFLLVFVFIVYAFIQASLKFTYAGLEFEKVREGDLILYRTPSFPVFFREDPRKLRDIEIEGRIVLQKRVGIGGDIEVIEGCEDSTIAATTLSIFLGRAGLQPFPATTDKEEAENFNVTYVECSYNQNYSAIIFKKGDENKILKKADCNVLQVKDCDSVMNLAERFMVASYAHSRGIYI